MSASTKRDSINSFFASVCVVVAIVSQGCAGVTYTAINTPEQDQKAKGFRYYDTSPYLLITRQDANTFTSQLLYLPDQTKKFQAHPYCFLAINNNTFTYGNGEQAGVLTDTSVESDSTAVPAAIIAAAQKVAAARMMLDLPPKVLEHDVLLGKIVKRNHEWGIEIAFADSKKK